jgi:hypothetical protein
MPISMAFAPMRDDDSPRTFGIFVWLLGNTPRASAHERLASLLMATAMCVGFMRGFFCLRRITHRAGTLDRSDPILLKRCSPANLYQSSTFDCFDIR